MFPLALLQGAIGSGPVVTVSGETISQSDPSAPYNSRVAIQFNSDGTIDKITDFNGTPTVVQIDAGTDWIIPNIAAGIEYDVRFVSGGGDLAAGFDVEAAVEDTWIDLGSDRLWSSTSTIQEEFSGTATFEIRHGGSGITLDSAVYTFTISNTV